MSLIVAMFSYRQRALKALDERLNKSSQSQQIEWPLMDENINSSSDETTSAAVGVDEPSYTNTTVPEVIVKLNNDCTDVNTPLIIDKEF